MLDSLCYMKTKYQISDYLVCPGHGVGQVVDISSREIAGTTLNTVTVQLLNNGMKMIYPENSSEIRALVTTSEVEDLFSLLSDHEVNPSRETWNRRYRDYMTKVNSGSILEIADVLRSLLIIKFSKKLSFSEKKMVDLCKDLMIKEIAITTGSTEKEVDQRIEAIFTN